MKAGNLNAENAEAQREKVRRPMLRYHGGKWILAPWIISHFPPHRVYTECFGGAASVLLRKDRSHTEVYNDLDGEIVSLFRVVRERGEDLQRLVELTPFSREEYRGSFITALDPLEQARRTLIRSFMGFGSNSLCRAVKSGFRANSTRRGNSPARDWRNWPSHIPSIVERLQGVVIERRTAAEVMCAHDGPESLHYCDPPYVHSTRRGGARSARRLFARDGRRRASRIGLGARFTARACDFERLSVRALRPSFSSLVARGTPVSRGRCASEN